MDPLAVLVFLLVLTTMIPHYGAAALLGGDESFVFNSFPQGNLTMDGAARVASNGLLQLTEHNQTQKGHAFFPTPFRFKSRGSPPEAVSFSTTFVFAIVPMVQSMQAGTHGMAFVVSPSPQLNDDPTGRYLGVFNSTNIGNFSNHIFAVEFDLVRNTEFNDANDNHVGVDVNGLISVQARSAGYYADGAQHNFTNLTLASGEPMQLWLDFDAEKMQVDVTLAPLDVAARGRPAKPLISTDISNLSNVFLNSMYIGFAGATGRNGPVVQYVLGWSFKLGRGPAPPLDLRKLPKLPKIGSPKPLPWLLTVLLPVATVVVLLVAISGAWLVWQRKKKFAEILEDWEIELYGPHRFCYKDLYLATKGFSEKELLGVGGFGTVYRGVLRSSGAEVAVKKVSHDSRQGIKEFVAEIVSIGRLRHRNLVQLHGYCRRKGELLLVYDYMPNGSLDTFLYADGRGGSKHCALNWPRRLHIIKGVGAALLYLHGEWEQVVIHRDVKSSNVLLDRDLNARLGDFGLARLYDHGSLPTTTHVVGTMGYMAPELTREGKASEATDVFAFGVFLLEVVCGRRQIEPQAPPEEVILVDWVLRRWIHGTKLADCRDKRLSNEETCNAEEVELVIKLGLLCSHALPESRPIMKQVMQILEGELQLPELTPDYWSGSLPSVQTKGRFDDFLVTGSSASSSTVVMTGVSSASSYLRSGGR